MSAALARAMRKGVADGSITTLRQFIQEQEKLRAELEMLIAPLESGRPRTKAVEAASSAPTCNYIPQGQDSKKLT